MFPHPLRNSFAALGALGALSALASCGDTVAQEEPAAIEAAQAKPRLGLFTTLPIYWGEDGMDAILAGTNEGHWVRAELETQFELVPLDTLEAEALAGLDRVLLAQPRPLAPSENVAFDQFLAEGGTAVILADPMLTSHSEYGIGDRRRPQDVVLLSPILKRLGLELVFEEGQPDTERSVRHEGNTIPVHLSGRFLERDSGSASRECSLFADGLIAQCRNGEGTALLFADAALLDWEGEEPVPQVRKQALRSLLVPLTAEDVAY